MASFAEAFPLDGLDGLDEELALLENDDVISKVLADANPGVGIRESAQRVESEMREIETASVDDYLKESTHLENLHNEIADCDSVLEDMEHMLTSFQKNLGNISSEIKHLQDESLSMKLKLRNRKAVEAKLRQFIDAVALPPDLISNVCESEVNEAYLEFILALNKKMSCLKDDRARATLAFQDVEPELEKLRAKAAARIRDFLLQKVDQLKMKRTNIQILQQNVLLKYKYFNTFLAAHAPEVSVEVRGSYVETMSRYYHSKFKTYTQSLLKLQVDVAAKDDLVGGSERSSGGGMFSVKKTVANRTSVFSLGERHKVLEQVGVDSIIPHIAAENKEKFAYECLFRSMVHLLCESATTEYLFTHQFFGRMDSIFHQIFAKTIGVFLDAIEDFLGDSYDAVGLLLMIRLTREHQLVMSRRRVPVLDGTFDKVNLSLWPRFKKVFDANLDSVSNPREKPTVDGTQPHFMSRKYAELAASIHCLNQGVDNEMLTANMAHFLSGMEKRLVCMSQMLSGRKNQHIFLINNYDVVLAIHKERNISCDDTVRLEELLSAATAAFVEEELQSHFGRLIGYVKEVEPLMQSGNSDQNPYKEEFVSTLLKDFSGGWQGAIDKVNGSVMKYFSNFKNGMEILKHVLTQLLLYYTRFLDIIKTVYGPNAFSKEIVSLPNIMHEIKKYSRTFV
eukprot:TRINITY_DN16251_c0_g1_i1.p1 TRINITY_DN16251_c0_g1~~TRINITY_DN16251_c0_g1_i1.p1  ORF type:complete len:679 (-),score=234.71 TRINITY_DN16251_c0_g1_i1:153-2189(-)